MTKLFIVLTLTTFLQDTPSDKVFSEGRTWTYLATTWKDGNVEKTDTLTLTVEKGNFFISQQKISWSLKHDRPDGSKEEILEITGVVENKERIWIHPPRLDYFKFTELTAFPEIRFPLDQNQRWTSTTSIGKGWGQWENEEVESKYQIDKATTNTKSIQTIKVKASSTSKFGTYQTNYLYDSKIGFKNITYLRPDNILTEIELLTTEKN